LREDHTDIRDRRAVEACRVDGLRKLAWEVLLPLTAPVAPRS